MGPSDKYRRSLLSSRVLHLFILDVVLLGVLGIELDTSLDFSDLMLHVI